MQQIDQDWNECCHPYIHEFYLIHFESECFHFIPTIFHAETFNVYRCCYDIERKMPIDGAFVIFCTYISWSLWSGSM